MHIHIQLKTYTGIPRSSVVKHTLIGLLDRGLIFFQIGTNTKSMKSTVQLKSVCFLYFEALCSNICLRFYTNSNLLCCDC